jgi:hypothetical protein
MSYENLEKIIRNPPHNFRHDKKFIEYPKSTPMQTFRNLLLTAIKNMFLIWGTTIIAMTWTLGRPSATQIFNFYCFGAGLVLIHFVIKARKRESASLPL